MQSTIDRFFRKRKVSVLDEISDLPPTKRAARKLFLDEKLSLKHKKCIRASKVSLSEFKLKNYQEVPSPSTPNIQTNVYAASELNEEDNGSVSSALVNQIKLDSYDDFFSTSSVLATENKDSLTSTSSTVETKLNENNELHICNRPVDESSISVKSEEENPIPSTSGIQINLNEEIGLSTPKKSIIEEAKLENKEDVSISFSPQSKQNADAELFTPTRSPTSQNKLRQELALGEYKEKIKRSRRYVTLKQHMEKFNETMATFKEAEKSLDELWSSPKLNKFRTVELEITSPVKRGNLKPRRLFGVESYQSPLKEKSGVSPSKLLAEGPIKSSTKPAFERFHHLLAEGKDPLILPRKYLLLKEIFHWMETIIKIRNDRGETVTFKKIQPEMQRIIRRNFTEDHIGKIIAVYPAAYNLSQQRMKLPMCHNETYELVISQPEGNKNSSERHTIFNNLLLEKAKLHHQEFLKSLDPPLDIPTSKMKRWHPEFNVDEVPDVEPALIPKPPVNKDTLVSAKDVLEKTRRMISGNKRMERAVSAIINEKNKEEEKKTIQPVIANPIPAFQKALKGVPKAILDKIRAKQAARVAEDIVLSPAQVKETAMLSRLPELAKILRIVFVSEKKGILPEELVIEKVSKSFKEKMPKKNLIEHLQLISKHVPGWMNFCIVRNNSYIRLSKDADMTRIIGKLQNLTNPP